ncbi:hypothetical protein O181_015015 [Austropuccinia psidii MF-1]|uniref:Reverse transcriptase Ty1/copia-type domain-containing protein n=1 Tax=Austropuccinia psidii MF-1 TaxID=1389203 RepID=A0A9Q3GQH9_9BASI|nr:hypothetical protein [Austropuccinia psidii MF-1]
MASWLKNAPFKGCFVNPCVFYRMESKPVCIYVHINDLAIFGPDLTPLKQEIQSGFDIKDLGMAELLLGLRVNQLDSRLFLSQEHFVNKLEKEYEIKYLTPSNKPLKPNIQLISSTEDGVSELKRLDINYQTTIGELN